MLVVMIGYGVVVVVLIVVLMLVVCVIAGDVFVSNWFVWLLFVLMWSCGVFCV